MRFRPIDRDEGLRRVSRLTRWFAAGAVALIGGLSAVVAQALPGASSASSSPSPSGAPVPATTPSTTPATSPVQSTSPPATSDPNLQPAPAPVITHHHSVATSGGT
jgi:hypothetical protein